jgi:carbamoyl-phosphate synthase small subunit
MMTTATLALEDGTILQGAPLGASADSVFELVFNTSMTGYQEIISDPSYRGQAVVFTVSHVGNTGINREDNESGRPQTEAVVLRSLSPEVSSWRANRDLSTWLADYGVAGISGVDTRFLTIKLRTQGTLKAALSTRGTRPEALLEMARGWTGLDGRDMVKEASCREPYTWQDDGGSNWVARAAVPNGAHLVVYDFGAKYNILRHLHGWSGKVTVVPADYSAGQTLDLHPDGIMLSNGPGDPAGLPYAVEAVRGLLESGIPIFGICLGHQLIGRALGGETRRLKFGHHGGNHPVKQLADGRVLITAQNHNYMVDPASLDPQEVEVTHLSLNDGTLEGLRLRNKPVFSVQFHPEAAPGPHDAHPLFNQFFEMIRSRKENA